MDIEKLKESLCVDLKAIVCSSKDGVTERELKHDYRLITGQDIPYAALGYSSVYDLMSRLPFVEIKKHPFGDIWLYYPIYDDTTLNLGTLVFGQADRGKSIRERLRSKEIVFVRNHRSRSANVINYDNRHTTTPTNTFNEQSAKNSQSSSSSSRVPLLIKKQIEHILSTKQSPKPLTVEQFKQFYIRTFGFLFNPRAFGSENLTDFLKSIEDLVRLRPVNDDTSGVVTTLGEDQIYIELVQNATGQKFNLNVLNFNNLVSNEVNNNNNVLVEPLYGEITEQTRVKTRPVTVYDFNEGLFVEHTLNLIAIDKQIYVHWSQVARLFNLTEPVFKLIINQTGDMFVRKFKHNANNEILFDLIENRLKIATNGHRDERDEDAIVLVYYDRLFKCCDFIFRDENSKSLKQLIVKFWSE